MLSENVCGSGPRKRFPKSIRRQALSWLWNHKVDLKNWHLMAYNWNKSLEIGPRRETWVHTQRPFLGSADTREGGVHRAHQKRESALIGGEAPSLFIFQSGPNI